MRAAVFALVLIVLATPAAGAPRSTGRVAFLDRGTLRLGDVATGSSLVVARHVSGAVGLSGDGRFVSVGGRIVGGPTFPSARLVWAPTGETAAYQTLAGAVFTWSPATGRRLVVGASWGATSFAWGRDGALALGRAVCHVPCGVPLHEGVWIRRGGSLRRVAGPLSGEQRPLVAAVAGDVVSPDPSRSWVSPSCNGHTLVAAASVNTTPLRIGHEHRAIWQLLPTRRRLTNPPTGFTDEFPRLFRDGSVLFVRTGGGGRGMVELLRGGKLTALGPAGPAANYYGHYDWPDRVAVSP